MSTVAQTEQTKVRFSSQIGTTAAHGKEMLKFWNTSFICTTPEKVQNIYENPANYSKFHPVCLNQKLYGHFNPLFSIDLLYKRIFLLKPQTINKLT